MKRKRILVSFLIGMFALNLINPLMANNQTILKLALRDGTIVSFALSEQPVLTFENNQLLIATRIDFASYQLPQIKEYYFEELMDGVEKVQNNEVRIIRQSNDEVEIHGVDVSAVAISDLLGRRQSALIKRQGNVMHVSLRQLPTSTYIIHFNNQSIKIIKR